MSTNRPESDNDRSVRENAKQSRAHTIRLLRVLTVASLVLPVILFVSASWISYHDAWALADERIDRSLEVTQEQALKVLQSVNLAFVAVGDLLDGLSREDIRRDEAQLRDRLNLIARALPEVRAIWAYGEDGNPEVTTAAARIPPSPEFAQQDFIRASLEGYPGTFVGRVREAKFGDSEPVFPLSRAWRSNGALRGVLEISLRPSNFGNFYSRIATGPGLQYAIIRQDGVMLSRYPEPQVREIRLEPTSGFGRTIQAHPEGGYYTVTSQVDQIPRRFGLRPVEGYPLYLTAGIAVAEIRAETLAAMAPHLIFGLPASLFVFALLQILARRTHRLHQEQDRREDAESAQRQSQKMEAVGQLTGGVAHDFNNLLMIIIGNLEIVQRLLDDRSERALMRLHRSSENAMLGARRAAVLTQRLLAFSRRTPLNPRPLDLNRLVTGLSDFLARSLGETIAVEVVGAAGLWTAEADQAELEAAIINLSVNARDAMPDGGRLTIETSNAYLDDAYCAGDPDVRPGQYVLLAVTDTGAGMSREVIDRAFEPFFTTKPAGQGTGLGLSQVYGFVKQSGGHLKIYSEIGHGTTLKIYLPRITGDALADKATPGLAISSAVAQGESVLVVEDDASVRIYIVETLQALNYKVQEAATAEDALDIAAQQKFDLLLTDVVLPGRNGRELADALKAQQPGMRVLYLTGYSRNAIVHNGRLDRGVDMLQKPVTSRELAEKIRSVLGAPRLPPDAAG